MSRWSKKILIITALAWLTLGCQAITDFTASLGSGGTPETVKDWPHSTFVPLWESVAVDAGQPLNLDSSHVSPAGMARLEILVNDEPVQADASSDQGAIFSNEQGNLQLMVNARHEKDNAVIPEYPNDEWLVSMIWIGHVPGTYDLTLVSTDVAKNKSESVTQRIEVK